MPVYTRFIAFPVTLTAENEVAADRGAMDHAIAAVQHIEGRDVTGSLTVGKITATPPALAPAPARAEWLVAYGRGPLAMERVARWLAEGRAVDSRLVRGTWVHKPVGPDACGKAAVLPLILAAADAGPNTVLWAVDPKAGAA